MMNKNVIIGFVVLMGVVLVVGFGRNNVDEAIVEQDQHMIPGNGLMVKVGKNAINVNEQKLGDTATVSFVVLEKKGYVVVHEMVAGKPGKVLGVSTILSEGKTDNVEVPLSSTLLAGKSYGAMLHLDNGDGVFNVGSDVSANDENVDGRPIMMEFQASAEAVSGGVIAI